MNFKDLARVLRPSNLLIILITQLLCWFCLIKPLAGFLDQDFFLDFNNALLLAIGTALIAGAGYIINDYFDVKIDAINRPEKSLIGKDINPRTAILLHNFCNIAGLGIMAYLSYQLQNPKALIIPIICTILLWFYSTHFKRQFMIGNIVVSLLTALSLIILIAFEPLPQHFLGNPFPTNNLGIVKLNPVWILLTYSGFAFYSIGLEKL
jgi:4-hydroxybenzoate polyprenyltransferase